MSSDRMFNDNAHAAGAQVRAAKPSWSRDLSAWVKACRDRRALVVGDLILDRYLYGDAERISPEAPVPVLRLTERREGVGGSGNVAACLRALGCRVVCCGVVGSDRHGQTLQRLLTESGIDTAGVIRLPDRPTTTKTRLVGLAQHRHRQQLMRLDEEDVRPLPSETMVSLSALADELLNSADVVCLEDYDKGVVREPLAQAVIRSARRHGRKVLVDPARVRDYGRYRGASILTPNREELSMVTGRSFATLDALAGCAIELISSLDVGAAVVTVDRDGAVVVERSRQWRHFPTVPRGVYDNTGAGDAVLAMLAAALAAGADLAAATQLANVAGGLEVEKFGCVPVSAEEMLAELRLKDRLENGKLRSADELSAELQIRRDRGETVAFTNGCFDLLHAGHVELLRRCRREASILIVGINTDPSVPTLNKGPDRPVNAFADRAVVVAALECVDYVVGFNEPDPEALIRRLRPDVLIKGEDWAGKSVAGREFVESAGGRMVFLPLVEGHSTTKLIERIRRES